MSTAIATPGTTKREQALAVVQPPRLPYHPAVQEKFGLDQTDWRALVDSVFPSAKTTGAVVLALSYCRARKLDPFRKVVHIVPVWDKERRCEVETVWPGIAEYRTTAARTGLYAGHDEVAHGPMIDGTFPDGESEVRVKYPEWAQMTVYRLIGGQRFAFPGPRVYWTETYASKKSGAPNSMWRDRPIGMLDKCAEAAALRGAFPEELGGEITAEEVRGFAYHGRQAIDATPEKPQSKVAALTHAAVDAFPIPQTDIEAETAPAAEPLEVDAQVIDQEPTPATIDPAAQPAGQTPGEMAEWQQTIRGIRSIIDLKALETALPADNRFTAEQKAIVQKWIAAAAAVIRGTRGNRSNPTSEG